MKVSIVKCRFNSWWPLKWLFWRPLAASITSRGVRFFNFWFQIIWIWFSRLLNWQVFSWSFHRKFFFYDFWQISTFSVPHGLYTRNWLWLLFTCCRWSARNMAWRKDLIGWSSISIFFSFWIKGEKMKLWYKICWQSNLSEIEVSDGRTFENSRFFYIIILWTHPHWQCDIVLLKFFFVSVAWYEVKNDVSFSNMSFLFKNVISLKKTKKVENFENS